MRLIYCAFLTLFVVAGRLDKLATENERLKSSNKVLQHALQELQSETAVGPGSNVIAAMKNKAKRQSKLPAYIIPDTYHGGVHWKNPASLWPGGCEWFGTPVLMCMDAICPGGWFAPDCDVRWDGGLLLGSCGGYELDKQKCSGSDIGSNGQKLCCPIDQPVNIQVSDYCKDGASYNGLYTPWGKVNDRWAYISPLNDVIWWSPADAKGPSKWIINDGNKMIEGKTRAYIEDIGYAPPLGTKQWFTMCQGVPTQSQWKLEKKIEVKRGNNGGVYSPFNGWRNFKGHKIGE